MAAMAAGCAIAMTGLAAGSAEAGGTIVTAQGELPFDGLFVNDVGALDVTSFGARMSIVFKSVSQIEFVSVEPENQVATIRITFHDGYAMPAEFPLAENTPWLVIGSYGHAFYDLDALMAGAIDRIEFDPPEDEGSEGDGEGDEGADNGASGDAG